MQIKFPIHLLGAHCPGNVEVQGLWAKEHDSTSPFYWDRTKVHHWISVTWWDKQVHMGTASDKWKQNLSLFSFYF